MDKLLNKQRAVMIAAMFEGMMLFVGYGKPRPPGVGDIEEEVVAACLNLAGCD